jgi:endonuclease/exonuclease/phosphatase (EEP) superfamily protein YafD
LLLTLVVGVPFAVFLVWPQAFGAERAFGVAQFLAFRAPLALALGVVALLCAAVALFARRWGIAAGIAIVLGAASLGNGAVLFSRGHDGVLPDGDLTVLVWNTQGGATPPDEVARLVLDTGADIVSLPEMDEVAAAEVARLVADGGRRVIPHTTRGETGQSWIPTSLLITEDLGAYRVDKTEGSTPGLPSAVWRSVDGDGPTIVAAHPLPPLPGSMDQWRAGLEWVAAQCDAPDVILAGDLNATVDHMSGLGEDGHLIGGCEDAAMRAHAAATGTWPSTAPAWLASPIDHVLFGSAWTVRGARILESPRGGTDHRAIVAVLDAR